MRNFTPRIIAIASLLAAVPLSSAYAAHRHRVEPQAMSVEARAVLDQLQGVKQGVVEARDAKAITLEQEHDLMMRADSIRRSAMGGGAYQGLLSQIESLDQRLQDDSGGGLYIGDGSDGGYYPNGRHGPIMIARRLQRFSGAPAFPMGIEKVNTYWTDATADAASPMLWS